MSDQERFDARLAAHFEREHRVVPADSFIAATMRKVRVARRRREVTRIGLRVLVLVATVLASPWLIAGVTRMNAMLESILSWGQAGTWVLGALAVLVVLAMRVRSR